MKTQGRLGVGLIAGLSLIAAGALLIASGQEHRLALRREISTRLRPETLWSALEAAFRDSTASPVWPNELETLRSAGLAAGAQVTATYKMPLGTSSHTYTIGEYSRGEGFTYVTGPEHPLQGGGRVLIVPAQGGAKLVWSIDYSYRSFSPTALFVRFYFAPRFFTALEANLRRLE